MSPDQSVLKVRRSVHIRAPRRRVWQEFVAHDSMNQWWGILLGTPIGGEQNGMRLIKYEPTVGGRAEMEVSMEGKPARFGGPIVVFNPERELTIENDWIPNRGWSAPTYFTLRLSDAFGGTLVELFHHGFERTGKDASEDHAAYERGWGMTQLSALKKLVETGQSG